MAKIFMYETAELPIYLSDKEILSNCEHIIISISQGRPCTQKDFDESQMDINAEDGIITLRLSQEDTANFGEGLAELQVNFYSQDGTRIPSEKALIRIKDNLYKKVMSHE